MKCLSKLLFNVYADERQQQQQVQQQHKCLCNREEFAKRGEATASKTQRSSEAPASKAFERISADGSFSDEETRHGLTCLSAFTSSSPTSSVSLEQVSSTSRFIGSENLIEEDDWVLLGHEEDSQNKELLSSDLPARVTDEHELRQITVNNHHHHHCHLHSNSHLREPSKRPPQIEQYCRLANDIVVNDTPGNGAQHPTTTFTSISTTPVNRQLASSIPVDFESTEGISNEKQHYCNINLRTIESSGCKGLIYRARFNKRRSRDSSCLTEVNLPTTTAISILAIKTTVTMDSTDIELIRASWKPAREDPVAAGALLFKG